MCHVILVFCQEMLHAKLTEVLRGNYFRVICFETELIGHAVQLTASQEELGDLGYLGYQRIKGGRENGFEEGDGIGDGIVSPPCAINTAGKGFVGIQSSTIHVLNPVTLAGLAISIRLYFRDDALQIDVIKFLFAYQLGGIFDRVAVKVDALARIYHYRGIIVGGAHTGDGYIDVLPIRIREDGRVGSKRPALVVVTGIILQTRNALHIAEDGCSGNYATLDVVWLTHRIKLNIERTARNPIVRILCFCCHFFYLYFYSFIGQR